MSAQDENRAATLARPNRRRFIMTAAALAAGTGPGARSLAQTATVERIPLSVSAGLDTSPLFAAIDQGIFRQYNIVITPHIFFTGVEHVNSAASGQSMIATIGVAVHAASVQRGIPLRIVALQHGSPIAETYSTVRAIARRGAGVTAGNFASLRGKRIGAPIGTDGELGAYAYLATAGLTRADVNMVNVSPPDMVGAMTSGSVDAIIIFEPWPTAVELAVPGSFRMVPEAPPIFSPGILVASKDTITGKRDLLKRFLKAASAGQKWARANTAKLLEINGRWTQIPDDVAQRAINNINFDMRLSRGVLRRFSDVTMPGLVSVGIINRPIPLDDFVDPSLMKEVQAESPDLFSDLPPIPAADVL